MKYKDIKNQRFGHLKTIKPSSSRSNRGQMYWICRCDCGRLLEVRGDILRYGGATRCSVCRGEGGRTSRFMRESDISD